VKSVDPAMTTTPLPPNPGALKFGWLNMLKNSVPQLSPLLIPAAVGDGQLSLIGCPLKSANPAADDFPSSDEFISRATRTRHKTLSFAERKSGDVNNPYVGLAAIIVLSIRGVGSEVTDSREEFCGHAHISHGAVVPEGEPLEAALSLRIRALSAKAKLLLEPTPDA